MNVLDRRLEIPLDTAHVQYGQSDIVEFYYPKELYNCAMKVLRGEYEHPSLPDYPKVRRVLDIGGNIGAFAMWAYSKWPGCWIDSYEPNGGACEVYRKNAPPGAVVHQVAVTVEPKAELYIGGDWGWSSTKPGMNPYEEHSVSVPVMHPKELPSCDVLKVDAEGVELEIFEHYPHWNAVNICMFEWHREEDRGQLEMWLYGFGLRCFALRFDRNTLGQEIWIRSHARWNEPAGRYALL